MGIRGLSSFVANNIPHALQYHELHDCHLVIDGNNLAHYLHDICRKTNDAFGGEYYRYTERVQMFFKSLHICNIEPLVVMDGGTPPDHRKFRTSLKRIRDRLAVTRAMAPTKQNVLGPVFPLLGLSVFINIVHELGITVLQSDFEADDDIVALVWKLNAYATSNDSDFYIRGIPFVRLETIECENIQSSEGQNLYKYIPCQKFNFEYFCKETNVSKPLLPVLGSILGNDSLDPDDLLLFLKKVPMSFKNKFKTKSTNQFILNAICMWLSRQDPNPEEVIGKVVGGVCNGSKKKKAMLKQIMRSYLSSESSLVPWVLDHEESCPLVSQGPEPCFLLDPLIPTRLQKQLLCTCFHRCFSHVEGSDLLPRNLLMMYRLGLVPREVANILCSRHLFSLSQVEVFHRQSIFLLCAPVVHVIRLLLWKSVMLVSADQDCALGLCSSTEKYDVVDSVKAGVADKECCACDKWSSLAKPFQNIQVLPFICDQMNWDCAGQENGAVEKGGKRVPPLQWFVRKGYGVGVVNLPSVKVEHLDVYPALEELSSLSCVQKRHFFMTVFGVSNVFKQLPSDLLFLFFVCYYWYANSSNNVSSVHIVTIIMFVVFCIVCKELKGSSLQLTGKESCSQRNKQHATINVNGVNDVLSDSPICSAICALKKEDVRKGFAELKAYQTERRIPAWDFKREWVHDFGEFQASVYFFQVLNSILGFPFPLADTFNFWSGTFSYNMMTDLEADKQRTILMTLGHKSSLVALFLALYDAIQEPFGLKPLTFPAKFEIYTVEKDKKSVRNKAACPKNKCKKRNRVKRKVLVR